MKPLLHIGMAAITVGFLCAAARGWATPGQPRIAVEAAERDFGATWTGLQLRHEARVSNTGDAELTITAIEYPAGCYQTADAAQTIPAGGSITLAMAVDTRDVTGAFERLVVIRTNDPATPTATIRLRGECRAPIELKPAFLGFGKVTGDGPQQRSITIINRTDESFELRLTKSEDAHYKYELIETTPGEEYQLFATTRPPMVKGRVESTIELETSLEAQPRLPIRVFAFVPQRLEVMPATVTIEEDKAAQSPRGLSKVLVYSNNGDKPAHIKKVSASDPAITVTSSEIIAGKSYRIVVQVPQGYKPPKGQAFIYIETDDPVQNSIRIPVRGDKHAGHAHKAGDELADTMTIVKSVGRPAPAFELTTTDGVRISNADLASKVTIFNFFMPGDVHNTEQLAKCEQLRQSYADRGVRFVNVFQKSPFTDVGEDQMHDFIKESGFKSELCFDLGNSVGKAFHLTVCPTFVAISKSGTIEAAIEGNLDDFLKQTRAVLDTLVMGRSLVTSAPTPSEIARRPALGMIGKTAPEFSLTLGDGRAIATDNLDDHPATVLDFVAANCGFCRRQIPVLETVRPQYEARGVRFAVVGQTMRKEFTREELEGVLQQLGSHAPLAHDPKNDVGKKFRVTSYPTLVVLGKDGRIVDVIIGAKQNLADLLSQRLDGMLATESK